VSGGVSGVALLVYYLTGILSPGIWMAALSVPVFALGWFAVSRRFFFYSLYGMAAMVLCMELFTTTAPVGDPMLAALASGAISGAGTGIALRTLGSLGAGHHAVALKQRFSLAWARDVLLTPAFLGPCFSRRGPALYPWPWSSSRPVHGILLGMFQQRKFASASPTRRRGRARDAHLKRVRPPHATAPSRQIQEGSAHGVNNSSQSWKSRLHVDP
jgi:hypothetical protein